MFNYSVNLKYLRASNKPVKYGLLFFYFLNFSVIFCSEVEEFNFERAVSALQKPVQQKLFEYIYYKLQYYSNHLAMNKDIKRLQKSVDTDDKLLLRRHLENICTFTKLIEEVRKELIKDSKALEILLFISEEICKITACKEYCAKANQFFMHLYNILQNLG